MGPRITIDSATLMNKGFEILEAHWLFGFPLSSIEAIVHPQSAIHAILEFVDGFSLALVSTADMKLPIQYALTVPEREPTNVPRMDLVREGPLTFETPDEERFPCLRLAREAGEAGKTYPAVLNAADEEAVRAFLEGRLRFVDIPRLVESCLTEHRAAPEPGIEEVLEADVWARSYCQNEVKALS
jgi:1-deoxy-D-xylulose-5-phosphate reductoisomerase